MKNVTKFIDDNGDPYYISCYQGWLWKSAKRQPWFKFIFIGFD